MQGRSRSAHDAIADRQVIPDQVELGLAAGREVHPVRIEIRTDRFPISSSTSPAIRRS